MPVAILISVITAVAESLANKYIKSDTAKRLINFSLDVFTQGSAVEMRLAAIRQVVDTNREAAKAAGVVWEPTEQDLTDIFDEIASRDEAWGHIGVQDELPTSEPED